MISVIIFLWFNTHIHKHLKSAVMKCQILTSKDPPNTANTDSPVSKPPQDHHPQQPLISAVSWQSLYHYLSLASYHPLSPPLLPAVSPLCYHNSILHLPCQSKINSTPHPSLSPCLLTSIWQSSTLYQAFP